MSTTTVYSSAADGWIRSSSGTYLTARSGTGTINAYATDTAGNCGRYNTSGTYYCNEAFLVFDTSGIPDADEVSSAALSLAADSVSTNQVAHYQDAYTRDWGATLTTADYVAGASLSGLTLAARLWTSGLYAHTVREFTSEDAMLGAVSKTGNTLFLVTGRGLQSETGPALQQGENVYWHFSEEGGAGTTFDPSLVITHFAVDFVATGAIALAGAADLTGYSPILGMDASGTVALDGIAELGAYSLGYCAASGTVAIDGYADLCQWEPMVATGTVSLDGEVWLSAVIHGDDTLQAIGTIELRGTAVRLSTGESLPATDDDGWTAPDVTTPDLRGLLVSVGGLSIKRAQITDLVIELDTEGGPKSATLSVNCALTRAPKLMQTLVVTYKGQTLFRGRLENISSNVDSSTGYTLTYAGPLVTLRDHKAYRQVFVDSDLSSWRTDQGPQTSPDTFDGIATGV